MNTLYVFYWGVAFSCIKLKTKKKYFMDIKKFKPFNGIYLLVLFLFSTLLPGQNNQPNTIYQLLTNTSEIPEIEVSANFGMLLADRQQDEYLDAKLTLIDGKSEQVFPVSLKLRGKYRRRICEFPPISLKFSKSWLKEQGFQKHNKLKLVTHCLEDKSVGNDNVLKEYLAYKLYQIISPNSYDVTLIKFVYVDEDNTFNKIKRYAILIEDTDEMADRVGGDEYEEFNPDSTKISKTDENIMALYQYMIGNEDWNIPQLKNVKCVEMEDNHIIPVPYDFDFSGLVNTSYAIPRFGDLGVKTITERYFLGYKANEATFQESIKLFKEKKSDLFQYVNEFDLLGKNDRVAITTYLDSFFVQIDDLVKHSFEKQVDAGVE